MRCFTLGFKLQAQEICDLFRVPNRKHQICSSLILELGNILAKTHNYMLPLRSNTY